MNRNDTSKKNLRHSPYMAEAGMELEWLPMDTKELYLEHLTTPSKRSLLENYGWIDSAFTYNINSNGFRCQEFSDLDSVVFLGCSITAGIGLPIETAWPTLVAKELNLACYNLGIGGISNDTAFRLAYGWLDTIKPKIVVYCQTFDHRLELLDDELGLHASVTKWTTIPVNGFLNRTRNAMAVNLLCNQLGIKFVSTHVNDMKTIDLARDLHHPGVESNRKFSEHVLKLC